MAKKVIVKLITLSEVDQKKHLGPCSECGLKRSPQFLGNQKGVFVSVSLLCQAIRSGRVVPPNVGDPAQCPHKIAFLKRNSGMSKGLITIIEEVKQAQAS